MTIPIAALLAFAVWTLLLLFGSVGVYRWSRILTGRVDIKEWRADEDQGNAWYRRAMRAHMNCVENLPVFAAIVIAVVATGTRSHFVDFLALVIVVARVLQSVVHVTLEQTNTIAGIRFGLFFVQAAGMLGIAAIVTILSL